MKSLLYILIFAFVSIKAFGQDPQFTQINNLPIYLNPATVGVEQANKCQLNHRGQWLGLPSYYITTSLAGEFYLNSNQGAKQRIFRNTSVGGIIINDLSGGTSLSNTYLAGLFATELRINPLLSLRSGVQLGFGNRNFNANNLVFGDMLTPNGISGITTQESDLVNTSVFYPDLGVGGLLYSPSWSLGLSIQHINQPTYSIAAQESKLPLKISADLSLIFSLDPLVKTNQTPSQYIKPTIMYRTQGKYDQLDLGGTIFLQPMVFGIWYRGLIIKKEGAKWNNQDAASIYIGSKWDNFEFGASYDLTISSLGSSTAGSYELSLIYRFKKPKSINGFTPGGAMGVECESFPGGSGMRKFLNSINRRKRRK